MNKAKRNMVIGVALCVLMTGAAGHAEDEQGRIPVFDDALDTVTDVSPFDVEMGFTLANIYLWRGQLLGTDTSWQPYVTVSPDFEPLGDFSFTYWADVTQHEPAEDNNLEMDFIWDYTVGMNELLALFGYDPETADPILAAVLDFSFSTGYIYYYFPPSEDETHEVYWGISYENLPLSPSMYIYNDFDDGSGVWIEWSVSHTFDLKYFELNLYSTLGYNHRQWGDTSTFSNILYGASIPVQLGSHMTVEPFLSYSQRLNETYTDDRDLLVHDQWYGGFNYSISF